MVSLFNNNILSLLVGLQELCKESAKKEEGATKHHPSTVQGEMGCLASICLPVDMGAVSPECIKYHVVGCMYIQYVPLWTSIFLDTDVMLL